MSFQRLVRFVPKGDSSAVLLGEPVDSSVDVGLALRKGEEVKVKVYSGKSVLDPGSPTDKVETVDRVLSPLAEEEIGGSIRCIGLNYRQHAEEMSIPLPDVPTVFLKPSQALADPWPAPTPIPKHTLASNSADYESELAVIISKTCKNVTEAEAMDHVLGYTAANDISSRSSQFAQSQWCYSKGFDKSCPLGPVLVSTSLVPDVAALKMRGLKNGRVLQDCGLDDMIFSIPQLVSFLSQGTTLPAGTVIITGTPAGIGAGRTPKEWFKDGDEFVVEILPHIGSLVNVMKFEE
ncbi:Fumarylacetoacetate hydrolase domain-containing protein 2 [Coniochaeta hoffmannii]|uniref:Fumarylacetoacetate hydrolase domain-containing protein 2 n=1 Tax=Coniochaeta hoffmannii TaxID=91930 RepID=A0AA38R785_9PEZI|nr:Fumarylacetoacetate hydrolase domain-containing protein 2 [Coniochaeta hoffmannii]